MRITILYTLIHTTMCLYRLTHMHVVWYYRIFITRCHQASKNPRVADAILRMLHQDVDPLKCGTLVIATTHISDLDAKTISQISWYSLISGF